jgi:hypothetical protein
MNNDVGYKTGRDYWNAVVVMTQEAQRVRTSLSITSPYENALVDVSILVISYNNESTIIDTLNAVVEAMGVVEKTFEIMVIDNGSTDRTIEMVRGYMIEFSSLKMMLKINHQRKGCYPNYLDAAFMGCGKYYRMVYGDNSEAVETMVDVFRALGEADIIVPYYVSMHRKKWLDLIKTQGYSVLVNLITGYEINFYNGLHVHLRFNVMRWRSSTAGAFFQTELLCQLLEHGFTCKQVPCRAVPQRIHGGWKMRVRDIMSALHTLLELIIRRFSHRLHKGGK